VRLGFPYDIEGLGAKGVLYVFTHARGYAHGRDLLCGVSAEHPLAAHAARHQAEAGGVHPRNASEGPAIESELANAGLIKKAMPAGLVVRHPVSGETLPVWVGKLCAHDLRRRARVMGRARAR